MNTNIGSIDRVVRFVLGLALLSAFFLLAGPLRWLGLVGVVCFLAIIWTVVRNVLRSMSVADAEIRFQAIACVIGILTLLVAVFMDQLFKPWLYIWPYIAISLRSAVLARTEVHLAAAKGSRPKRRTQFKTPVAGTSEAKAPIKARRENR